MMTCRSWLSHTGHVLTPEGWDALQEAWLSSGQVVECMSSNSIADIKQEEEELCSKTQCDYENTSSPLSDTVATSDLIFPHNRKN